MGQFSSELIEKNYLGTALPSEVLKYLDELSQQPIHNKFLTYSSQISEEVVNKALARNDRTIDLGLARVVDRDFIQAILTRYPNDEDILTVALSNIVAMSSVYHANPWVHKLLLKVDSLTDSQISALFTNPELPIETVVQALNKEDWCSVISDETYLKILWSLLKNPIISKEPKDNRDYDASQHKIISSCWNLLLNLTPNRQNASLLAHNINKFQEIEIPYEVCKLFNIDQSLGASNRILMELKEFLRIVFTKWVTPLKDDTEKTFLSREEWDWVRKLTIQKIPRHYLWDLKDFILEIDDPYRITGFFSSLKSSMLDKVDKNFQDFLSKYQKPFLQGLIENKAIYHKCNGEFTKKFYEAISNLNDPDESYFDSLRYTFDQYAKQYSNGENGTYYISDHSDLYENFNESSDDLTAKLDEKLELIQKKLISSTTKKSLDLNRWFEYVSGLISELPEKIDDLSNEVNSLKLSTIKEPTNNISWLYLLIACVIGYVIGKG